MSGWCWDIPNTNHCFECKNLIRTSKMGIGIILTRVVYFCHNCILSERKEIIDKSLKK